MTVRSHEGTVQAAGESDLLGCVQVIAASAQDVTEGGCVNLGKYLSEGLSGWHSNLHWRVIAAVHLQACDAKITS